MGSYNVKQKMVVFTRWLYDDSETLWVNTDEKWKTLLYKFSHIFTMGVYELIWVKERSSYMYVYDSLSLYKDSMTL